MTRFFSFFDHLPTPGRHLWRNSFSVIRENLHAVDIFRTTYLPRFVNVVCEWPLSTNLNSNSDPSFFQETLLKQVRITHGLFCILNLISLIVFIALVETHIFSDTHKVWLIMNASNRLIIYLIPITLLIMNTALSGAYTHHVKTLRDAVRTWDAITPSIPASSMSRRQV